MARPPRIDFPDAVYHVTTRGNGRAGVLKLHGHHAGVAKAVAVTLASRLATLSGRTIGQHYGIGSSAISAIHRRLADRPQAMQIVEMLATQLGRKRTKCIVQA
jgi:hypothetical protein